MSLKHSIFLPTGFAHEYAAMTDPVAAYDLMTSIARAADANGLDSVWLADHYLTLPPTQGMVFEAWTSIAALLRDTNRIRIGLMVAANGYRHPTLAAKMASTLDVIGNGRFNFGIGAGWIEDEYHRYGWDFGTAGERLGRLREAVQIILAMWTEDEVTFDGKYYQVNGAINQPKGVQRPRIPMLIAGGGEKVTLRLVAEYGDACNVIADPATLEYKFSVLRKHCDDLGRDYASISRSTTSLCVIADTDEQARAMLPPGLDTIYPGSAADYCLIGTPDTIRERLAAYQAVGVDEIAITFLAPDVPSAIARYADAILG
jgi:F420-dependent oxidoreductase-like protein